MTWKEIFEKETGIHCINMQETPTEIWDYIEWLENRLDGTVEYLDKLAKLGNEPNYGNSIGNDIAKECLKKTKGE